MFIRERLIMIRERIGSGARLTVYFDHQKSCGRSHAEYLIDYSF